MESPGFLGTFYMVKLKEDETANKQVWKKVKILVVILWVFDECLSHAIEGACLKEPWTLPPAIDHTLKDSHGCGIAETPSP